MKNCPPAVFGVLGGLAWLSGLLGCNGQDIPHPVASTSASYCRNCHSTGRVGATTCSHDDRDDCTSCHEVKTRGDFPGPMSHRGDATSTCSTCHATGQVGAPRTSHLDEKACYDCHVPSSYGPWPSAVPHPSKNSSDIACGECHADVHKDARSSCVACHRL